MGTLQTTMPPEETRTEETPPWRNVSDFERYQRMASVLGRELDVIVQAIQVPPRALSPMGPSIYVLHVSDDGRRWRFHVPLAHINMVELPSETSSE